MCWADTRERDPIRAAARAVMQASSDDTIFPFSRFGITTDEMVSISLAHARAQFTKHYHVPVPARLRQAGAPGRCFIPPVQRGVAWYSMWSMLHLSLLAPSQASRLARSMYLTQAQKYPPPKCRASVKFRSPTPKHSRRFTPPSRVGCRLQVECWLLEGKQTSKQAREEGSESSLPSRGKGLDMCSFHPISISQLVSSEPGRYVRSTVTLFGSRIEGRFTPLRGLRDLAQGFSAND